MGSNSDICPYCAADLSCYLEAKGMKMFSMDCPFCGEKIYQCGIYGWSKISYYKWILIGIIVFIVVMIISFLNNPVCFLNSVFKILER